MSGKPNTVPAIKPNTRRSIPSGYVVGRISTGTGDVELIPIDKLSRTQIASGLVQQAGNTKKISELGFHMTGHSGLGPDQYFYFAMAESTTTFPSTSVLAVSRATCTIAPSSNVTMYVVNSLANFNANGPTGSPSGVIATVTFTANVLTGTVTWAAGNPFTVNPGDILYFILGDTFPDDPIEGIQVVLVGDYVSG